MSSSPHSAAQHCVILTLHILCVPAGSHHGTRSGEGTPLPCPCPHCSLQLLPGISSHQGLIWIRARDARLRAFPCCLLSHSTKPRHYKHCTKPFSVYQVLTESPVTACFILLSFLLPISCCSFSLLGFLQKWSWLKNLPVSICRNYLLLLDQLTGHIMQGCSRFILLICGHGK